MTHLSASDAIEKYEAELRAVPGVLQVHVGFDGEHPTVIVIGDRSDEDFTAEIHSIAPDAPIELVVVAKPESHITAPASSVQSTDLEEVALEVDGLHDIPTEPSYPTVAPAAPLEVNIARETAFRHQAHHHHHDHDHHHDHHHDHDHARDHGAHFHESAPRADHDGERRRESKAHSVKVSVADHHETDQKIKTPAKHQDVRAAYRQHAEKLMKIPAVKSVNVGRQAGKDIMIVRSFPLNDDIKSIVTSIAPCVKIKFKKTPHAKNSFGSISEFCRTKLWKGIAMLAVVLIALVVLSPVYCSVWDFWFVLEANTISGAVIEADKPFVVPNTYGDIEQKVKVEFMIHGRDHYFMRPISLLKTGLNISNPNADPYHVKDTVNVAYLASDPDGTARIFNTAQFFATIMIYMSMLAALGGFGMYTSYHWREW